MPLTAWPLQMQRSAKLSTVPKFIKVRTEPRGRESRDADMMGVSQTTDGTAGNLGWLCNCRGLNPSTLSWASEHHQSPLPRNDINLDGSSTEPLANTFASSRAAS